MPQTVIGVDLGGTNVRAGSYFEDGTPAGPSFSNPSRAQEGTDHIMDAVASTINQAVSASGETPSAVGMAIPGHIDDARGTVRWAPNFGYSQNGVFKEWRNVPIREPLTRRLGGVPIKMGNDANLAALGEYRFGSGRGEAKCLVMLTIGTGIGGGVVMAPTSVLGKAEGPLVLVGGNGGGAELGHTVILHGGMDCLAGTYGAIEAYCQRDGIIGRAVNRLRRGRRSLLSDLTEGDLSRITPRLISEAATQGDELAIQVFRETGEYLGVGIGNFINIFAPDVFAIGGQIAKAGDFILGPAVAMARDVAIGSLFEDCTIGLAEQIEDAGMLGAAALALESLKWS
ncbi:ROK family protein [bacterium]|nr:MAG: ROK family protein [bacterium]